MAKVEKVEKTDSVVEKKVEKKLAKGSKKALIPKRKELKKISLMELPTFNLLLIIP